MHFKMSSAICFNLDQSKILSSGSGLICCHQNAHNSLDKVNPFPNKPFCDCPKFKEAADDNQNVALKGF